jgi:hypothetical protein
MSPEPDSTPRAPVIVTASAAVIISVALAAGAWFVLGVRRHGLDRAQHLADNPTPQSETIAGIHVDQFRPLGEADRVRARQHTALQQYAWTDRARGLVHIPIDVAIALELQEQR